ncbi:MAG: hypothetical protein ABR507_07615 [Actinomycetota bacterium]
MATAPRHIRSGHVAPARPASRPSGKPARPTVTDVRLKVIPGGRHSVRDGGRASDRPVSKAASRSTVRVSAEALRLRRARLVLLAVAGVLLGAIVFALVLLNIYVAQSSFRIGDLKSKVSIEEQHYKQMRYEVARQESPARVAQVAVGLGMVVPDKQEYIVGPPGTTMIADRPSELLKGNAQGLKSIGRDQP